MTHTEKKLLLIVGSLGLLAVVMSLALAGTLLVAGTQLSAVEMGWPSLRSQVTAAAAASGAVDQEGAGAPVRSEVGSLAAGTRGQQLERLRSGAGQDLSKLYAEVTPGVVSIEVRQTVRSPFSGRDLYQQESGSGFVYDDQHIVTNSHVVGAGESVEVVFFDGQRRRGSVLATDDFSDLAVVTVDRMPDTARALPVLDGSDEVAVGEEVVAIGNPFGNANTMTYGIVSALGRVIPSYQTLFSIPQVIQTDAAINPGNSGGPLINMRGRVIGVNAQIKTNNIGQGVPGNSGVGFAIPASLVERVVPALIKDGSYKWAYLGVKGLSDITLDVAEGNELPDTRGAYILSVMEGGPSDGALQGASNAATAPAEIQDDQGRRIIPITPANVVPVGGDVVIAVDGRPVDSFDDLLTYIALEKRPGEKVKLTVLRGHEELEAEVELGTRPEQGRVSTGR